MAKPALQRSGELSVGLSRAIRWNTPRGWAVFLGTALFLGTFGTGCGAIAKALLLQSTGMLESLLYFIPAMAISYFGLFYMAGGLIALFADGGIADDRRAERDEVRVGFEDGRDYAFVAVWLCCLGAVIRLTVYLLSGVLGIDAATDRDAIGYTVLLCLAVLLHVCARVRNRPTPSGR